jgi:hypothetical protein
MKRLLKPTTTRGEAGNFRVDNHVISGHVSGVPEQCSDGTVLTLEMYNGTRLNFTVDKDGVITVIGDVIDHALD